MKVCQILGGDEEGGLEKHVVELANGLTAQARVHVIAHEKYRARFASAVQFHGVDMTQGRRNPILLFQLWNCLRRIHPDVVHAHASKAAAVLSTLRRWIPGKKIATLHGLRKRLAAFDSMDGVIAINSALAARLHAKRVRVIPNGADIPPHQPVSRDQLCQECGIDGALPVVIAIGRLVRAKGYDVLVQAWAGLNASLVIIGDGDDRSALQAAIDRAGLQDRIKLLGARDLALRYLSAADLLVISSRSEGGPYTLVEALQLCVPVVATRVGMCPDWLPGACIADVDNAHSLHQVLQATLDRLPALKTEMAPVFARATAELSLAGMVSATLDFYREVQAHG